MIISDGIRKMKLKYEYWFDHKWVVLVVGISKISGPHPKKKYCIHVTTHEYVGILYENAKTVHGA